MEKVGLRKVFRRWRAWIVVSAILWAFLVVFNIVTHELPWLFMAGMTLSIFLLYVGRITNDARELICPCGKLLDARVNYCSNCGRKVASELK